ncbi:type VI secretion system-associated protein TagO [Rhodospirillaceae bacterium SYSU D60014]|uniref:type VI secretion system-associated protein TagO n=1 Tax=Virgifigura deserti TaxID=2268457 RepID=UPI000E6677D6
MTIRGGALGILCSAFLFTFFTTGAFASGMDEIRKGIARCAEMASDVQRLECYDGMAHQLDFTPEVTSRITASKWRVKIDESKFDDSKSVYMYVESDEPVRISRYDTVRPTFWVRCKENTTATIVSYDHFLGSGDMLVEYRIDREPARNDRWNISTNHNSIGLWRGQQSIPFIRRLFGKDTLLVRLTPYGENPATVSFTISGLRDEIGPLAQACNWSP